MMEIHQKWGFGMAPFKPAVDQRRVAAARKCMSLLTKASVAKTAEAEAEISELKGLFNRAHRQDQWDWFTTWMRLGQPSRARSLKIAQRFDQLRRAAVDASNEDLVSDHASKLLELSALRHLAIFVGDLRLAAAGGQIYVLSTREQPDVLKIGYTERTVEQRVKEINQATGVLTPYGVRGAWRVEDAPDVEKKIHTKLAVFRIREDREFFRLDYWAASKVIDQVIRLNRPEDEG